MNTPEEFKKKIEKYLTIKNKTLPTEAEINNFWLDYTRHQTPAFDEWLQNGEPETINPNNDLIRKLQEKTNWLSITAEIIKVHPIYYDKNLIWWRWSHNRNCWEITDETEISNIVDEVVKRNTLKGGVKSEMLEAFRRNGRKNAPLEPPKSWVQFKNAIIDIQTGEKIKPSPQYFLTNPLNYDLGDSTETPFLDGLLSEWAGEYALTLKQIIAYCCLRDYPLHRIFLLIGSGSNGKGTFLRMLNEFLGIENVTSAEMDLLVKNQFHVTKLHKKLCCQMSETNFSALTNTSKLKSLSGGDLIGFEYKNKLPFEDYNYAKIIIATNSLPVSYDKTDGFYRRWVIIDFNKQYGEKRDVLSEIPKKEYENLGLWCVQTLIKLLKDREFYKEGTIKERQEKYEARSNPLKTFLEEFYIKDVNGTISASEFYDLFSSYLQNKGMRALTYHTVRARLKEEGFEYERIRLAGFGDNPISCIIGISPKIEKSSHNITNSVSSVPVVPAFTISSPVREKRLIESSTFDTAGTELTPKTSTSIPFSTLETTLDKVLKLFTGKYSDNSIPVEIIQKKVPEATDEWIINALKRGDLFEPSAGWIKPL